MREDAVAVYIRHRNELAKAIYDGVYARQEAGDFLLSLRNLDNHSITFNPLPVDIVCKSYSNEILKNEGEGTPATAGGQAGGKKGFMYSSANLSRLLPTYGSKHPYVGRIKNSWTPADNRKHGVPLHIPGADARDNLIPLSMKHALWPELNSREPEEYNSFFFDEQNHPLRRKNAVTGSPEWRRKLREFYFSDDDSPSMAEQLMAAEKAHETHHSKKGSQVYNGVFKGKSNRRFTEEELEEAGLPPSRGGAVYEVQERNHPFIGKKTGQKESYGSHLHTIRLHDFERWKGEQGPERLAELEEQGKDLELAHFDDRMDALEGHGIHSEELNPSESDEVLRVIAEMGTNTKEPIEFDEDPKIARQQLENFRTELGFDEPEALEMFSNYHGEGMGWPTWMMGMEFLPPLHRTKVLEHLHEHDSDDELKQSIKLPDGTSIPMARIKTNMEIRNNPEFDCWNRDAHIHGANTHAHIQSEKDTKRTGHEGVVKAALQGIQAEPTWVEATEEQLKADPEHPGTDIENTAHDSLRRNIANMFEGEASFEDDITNLFPFSDRDISQHFKPGLAKGKNLLDLVKSKISGESDVILSKEGLMNLVGYNPDMTPKYEAGEHPIFDAWSHPKDLMSPDVMNKVLKDMEHRLQLAQDEKDIGNAYSPMRVGLNGPRSDALPTEEHNQWLKDGEKLRGWSWPFSTAYTHRGGHGRQAQTYRDIMHDFFSLDGGRTSMMGERMEREGGLISPNQRTVGMFGRMHHNPLEAKKVASFSALDILSKFDASAHLLPDSTAKGRNRKNNSSDTKSSFSPGIMNDGPRLEYANPSTDDYILDHSFGRNLSRFFVANPYTVIGSEAGDIGTRERAGMHHRLGMNASFPPHDPSPRLHAGYFDVYQNPMLRTSQNIPNADFLSVLGDAGRKKTDQMDLNLKDISGKVTSLDKLITQRGAEAWGRDREGMEIDEEKRRGPSTMIGQVEGAGLDDRYEALQAVQDEIDWLEAPWKGDPMSPHAMHPEEVKDHEIERWLTSQGMQGIEGKKAEDHIHHKTSPMDYYNLMVEQAYSRKDELEELIHRAEYENLKVQNKMETGTRRLDSKMEADKAAMMRVGKEKLLPMVMEQYPGAIDLTNPVQTMHNLQRIWEDCGRYLLHCGDHNFTTKGYGMDADRETTSVHQKLGESPHKMLAQVLQASNNEIHPNMKPEKALEILGLPVQGEGEPYHNHMKEYLDTLGGPVKAASLGQIATMGLTKLHPEMEGIFKDLAGKDLHTHMDDMVDNWASYAGVDKKNRSAYEREKRQFGSKNNAYNALSSLLRLVNPRITEKQEMDNFGLSHFRHNPRDPLHPPPLNRKGEPQKKGMKVDLNKHKNFAGHIVTFDENQLEQPLEDTEMGTIKKPALGFMDVPIHPLDDMTGNTVHDAVRASSEAWGYHAEPNIGFEYENSRVGGMPVIGTSPQHGRYPSVPQPVLNDWLTEEKAQQLLSSIPPEMQQNFNPQTSITVPGTALTHADDPTGISKADLPKQVPLIEPLHRVFDVEDLNQLRGFTGEWVVSVYREGLRCKVTKKKNRITLFNEDGEKQATSSTVRDALRSVCKKDFVVDGVIDGADFYINDILSYDGDDVTDLSTRERVKLLRGQFESYDPIHLPSPSDIKITDEVGLKEAVKELGKESEKILLRDAKSTYMKGEEKHPKWVIIAKADVEHHVSFGMEIDGDAFVIHLPEDLVKYDIVDGEATNPIAAIGSLTDSDYSLRLAKSLQPYWKSAFQEMLKEETEIPEDIEPDIDEEQIEEDSAGILKPKKDKNIIMKPNELYKTILLIERALEKLEKSGGVSNMHGRGLGIDVGGNIDSPRGPTTLNAEQSLPDWDMKKRPKQDMEKPEDYPGRERKKRKNATQSPDSDEKLLNR